MNLRCLPALISLACSGPPEVAEPADGACAERLDPLRDDDRTPFGLRPNQVRAQLSGSWTGTTDRGSAVTLTTVWTGGLALQIWATEQPDEASPDPAPPLWCQDRTELSASLRIQSDDPRLAELVEPVAGRMSAHGPLGDLQAGFRAGLPGADAPSLVPDGSDPAATTVFVWVWLDSGLLEVRAGADEGQTARVLDVALEPVLEP